MSEGFYTCILYVLATNKYKRFRHIFLKGRHKEHKMAYPPAVMTKMGLGYLFKIDKNKALVEFDYMYLVEMPLEDVNLTGVDLKEIEKRDYEKI